MVFDCVLDLQSINWPLRSKDFKDAFDNSYKNLLNKNFYIKKTLSKYEENITMKHKNINNFNKYLENTRNILCKISNEKAIYLPYAEKTSENFVKIQKNLSLTREKSIKNDNKQNNSVTLRTFDYNLLKNEEMQKKTLRKNAVPIIQMKLSNSKDLKVPLKMKIYINKNIYFLK